MSNETAVELARRVLDARPSMFSSNSVVDIGDARTLAQALLDAEEYAAEGWAWVDDALTAMGIKTVFDIENIRYREALERIADECQVNVLNDESDNCPNLRDMDEWCDGCLAREALEKP